MNLRYLAKARDDLDEIYFHIAQENEAAAGRLVNKLESAVQRLGNFPRSAPDRSELGEGLRGLTTGGYVIFYRVEPGTVTVLRVIHAARDLQSIDLT
ncbi:type II toxin-antitoxin system RelE/ParE family toxin [Sphingomonas sp. 37zxx]|uniref:type II toxin-antitoxin system RelE/ParE family toxin n=1 Tax=Sphingomonas sp. 37zxx TaxID=1550073 RepID=UPI00053BF111|nr:type II toxin-antitoxin system RelE/ParE family toxin [Sphingomonas sp. 37zxx]